MPVERATAPEDLTRITVRPDEPTAIAQDNGPSYGEMLAGKVRDFLTPSSGSPLSEEGGADRVGQAVQEQIYKPHELKAWEPKPTERLADNALRALIDAGVPKLNAQHIVNGAGELLSYTPLGVLGSAANTIDAQRRGDKMGVIEGMAGMIPGARPAKKAIAEAARGIEGAVAEKVAPKATAKAKVYKTTPIDHDPFPPPTGSFNPLDELPVTFKGKHPHEFTPDDWHAFGAHHGVDNLGPLSPLVTYKDMHGNDFHLPGGTHGEWTYYDLLHMKANPINPANVDRELHAEMQRKLGRTMTPKELTDADVWNGLLFGMTSPNNPLLPNQLTTARMRWRTGPNGGPPQMIDDLASMIPWKRGDQVTPQQRKIVNDAIAHRFGIDGAPKGGIGSRGTADYSRVGEMAQLFKEDPSFFRKKGNETWAEAVERISSQLPGLSMKTGSFGTVWQDPANAAISAIDRHMARELDRVGGIFASPQERTAWEEKGVKLWNKRLIDANEEKAAKAAKKGKPFEPVPGQPAETWQDVINQKGSDGFIGEMLLDHVGQELTPKFRLADGKVNPNIPHHLANAKWVREPESVFKMGEAYKRALDVNQRLADENGLNLFMSQWMEWDRIRRRFEPHENMFPGLSKTPAMTIEQHRLVNEAHQETGHKNYVKNDDGMLKPTTPLKGSPSRMGYMGLAGGAAGAAALTQSDEASAAGNNWQLRQNANGTVSVINIRTGQVIYTGNPSTAANEASSANYRSR